MPNWYVATEERGILYGPVARANEALEWIAAKEGDDSPTWTKIARGVFAYDRLFSTSRTYVMTEKGARRLDWDWFFMGANSPPRGVAPVKKAEAKEPTAKVQRPGLCQICEEREPERLKYTPSTGNIWTCQPCADLIDEDRARARESLRNWTPCSC